MVMVSPPSNRNPKTHFKAKLIRRDTKANVILTEGIINEEDIII